jgi:hypothetical protein
MTVNGFVVRSDDTTRRVEIASPDDVQEWVGGLPRRFPLQEFDAFINDKAGPELPMNYLATLTLLDANPAAGWPHPDAAHAK